MPELELDHPERMFTRFISSRNSRLRVRLVLRSNPLSLRLICFMPPLSHIGLGGLRLCRPSLALEETMMSTLMEDDIKRWTAKRKTALALDIIQCKTTISEASRAFDLNPAEVEQ